jgi:3-phosphoshikimate 1-carboxyvinyltransferase
LRGIDIDCRNIPDLAPILTVLGCFATGKTRICNVRHLAGKESNRIKEPASQLKSLGADIVFTDNDIVINHSLLKGGKRVSSCGDHRVAMALTIAGLRIKDGIILDDCDCISKSYPGFINDLKSLRAMIGDDPLSKP